jgi:hypothetical protein
MTHRIQAVRAKDRANLTRSLKHELLELFGKPCKIHLNDSLFFDPDQERKAIRSADWRIEYFGAKNIYEIAKIAMERRVPPSRTKNSKTELRINMGYKGVINATCELQAILQALPEKQWKAEQEAWFEDVKKWLWETYPDAVGLITLHTDKMRLHIEYVILKYGPDRTLLPCFKHFRHDGPGVTANRARAAIKGRRFSEAELKAMNENSRSGIKLEFSMRRRLLIYLREMGRDLRHKCCRDARKYRELLDSKMHKKSKTRRKQLNRLSEARKEFRTLTNISPSGAKTLKESPVPNQRGGEARPIEEGEGKGRELDQNSPHPLYTKEQLEPLPKAGAYYDVFACRQTDDKTDTTVPTEDMELFQLWLKDRKPAPAEKHLMCVSDDMEKSLKITVRIFRENRDSIARRFTRPLNEPDINPVGPEI